MNSVKEMRKECQCIEDSYSKSYGFFIPISASICDRKISFNKKVYPGGLSGLVYWPTCGTCAASAVRTASCAVINCLLKSASCFLILRPNEVLLEGVEHY